MHPPPDDELARCTKPFLEHLEDLRRTALWCAVSLAAGVAVAIPLAPWILTALKLPIARAGLAPDTFLRVLRVAGGFAVAARLVFWGGILLAIPFMGVAIAGFVGPGLTRRERVATQRSLAFAGVLFAGGVAMGYTLVLPVVLRTMLRINHWLGVECEFVELADYVAFALKLLIAFGLAFEMPVVLLALAHLGVITSRQLRDTRRHVAVGLLVAAMLLTPPDPMSQVLLAGPLMALYELCIWLIWARERKAAKAPQA